MNLPDKYLGVVSRAMERFLDESDDFAVAIFNESMTIDYCNSCFREIYTTSSSCSGRTIADFFSEEERELFPMDNGEDLSVYLSLGKVHSSSSALKCKIYRIGSSYILLGAVVSTDDAEVFNSMTRLANEMTNMSRDLKRKNRELREAQSKINTLSGIIPICMHCKEIRDDEGYWNNLEAFISEHSQAEFSHSICSKCEAKYYSDD